MAQLSCFVLEFLRRSFRIVLVTIVLKGYGSTSACLTSRNKKHAMPWLTIRSFHHPHHHLTRWHLGPVAVSNDTVLDDQENLPPSGEIVVADRARCDPPAQLKTRCQTCLPTVCSSKCPVVPLGVPPWVAVPLTYSRPQPWWFGGTE